MGNSSSSTEGKLKNRAKEAGAALAHRRAELSSELDELLGTLTSKVTDVRRALAEAADEGAEAAGHGLRVAMRKGRKGVRELESKWRSMDTRQRATVVAGLVAVLAAAAATPVVVRKVREARNH